MDKFKLNKKQIILILFIISLISTLYIYFKVSTNNKVKVDKPTPILQTTDQIASFNGITPGITNMDKVNELLGYPVEAKLSGDYGIDLYKTDNPNRFNRVISENGQVKMVQVELTEVNKKAEEIRKTYGIAPYILYSKNPSSVFDLFVYLKNGIAFKGHHDGTVLEIWYFEPTDSIENFISTWAKDYSTEKSKEIPKY